MAKPARVAPPSAEPAPDPAPDSAPAGAVPNDPAPNDPAPNDPAPRDPRSGDAAAGDPKPPTQAPVPVTPVALPTHWPADAVARRPVAELIPYARNARVHSDKQVAQLVDSIKQWGFTVPVLIDEAGGIIAGHGRVLAARRLGLTDVPVTVARGWSEEQKRAYVLADNKLAEAATWDSDLLRLEISELKFAAFDVGAIGFAMEDLRDIVFPVEKKAKTTARAIKDGLKYQIVVDCADEDDQAVLLEEFKARKLGCRPLIL